VSQQQWGETETDWADWVYLAEMRMAAISAAARPPRAPIDQRMNRPMYKTLSRPVIMFIKSSLLTLTHIFLWRGASVWKPLVVFRNDHTAVV